MDIRLGDILFSEDTGEHLLLLGRYEKERLDIGSDQLDWAWDMFDIASGRQYWEWEFVLCDSGHYMVVA